MTPLQNVHTGRLPVHLSERFGAARKVVGSALATLRRRAAERRRADPAMEWMREYRWTRPTS